MRHPERRGPVTQPRSIDILDRQIIEALQEDGRESFRAIAARLDVSEATIRNRYSRLCDSNVLQVTAVTNPLGLGYDGMAMIGIKTSGPAGPVADAIVTWREASYVVMTAGQFDLLVELVCLDRRHLLELINRVRTLDDVASTESFVYLELSKQLYDWAPGPGGVDRASTDRSKPRRALRTASCRALTERESE